MSEMPDVLKLHADGTPDKHAVIVDASHGARPSVTTFGELNELVNRVAHGLRALGVQQGDRIVWCGPNSLEVITVIHAARKAGLVAVPLSYRFNAEEMQYVIDNSDATLVVADAEYAPVVDSVRDQLPKVRAFVGYAATEDPAVVPAGWTSWAELVAGQSDEEPVAPDSSEVGAQMLYTSGTTGKPKGALRTTTNREIVFALLAELGLQFGNEVHITTGPIYHSGPLASSRSPTRWARRSSSCAASTRSPGSRR
jgi:acyl-coenzyme A synthetase/AMP-(fatty) acid ligase